MALEEKESTVPKQPTGKKSRRWIALLALLILVILLSIAGVSFFQSTATQRANTANTATAQTNQKDTTATAQANTTATATAQHNAYISALSANGTLAFSDSLNKESGSQWQAQTQSDETTCEFESNAYHIKPQGTLFDECDAPGTYSNFAFEVQITILQGSCAGMVFRSDENGKFYYFSVYQSGMYDIGRYANYGLFEHLLPYVHTPVINTGLGQTNKLAVRAEGSTLTFYINEQQVQTLNDPGGYSAGSIGLAAYPNIGSADAAYTNAQLWTL